MAKKERLDVLVVQQGLADTREKAQKYIMAGMVLVNDQKMDKAGTKVPTDAVLRLVGEPLPYASRGGFKLAEAFKRFPISMQDAVVVDLGASTGGFVDCALQNGAKRVYAVDVGYGQLAWKLRTDPRVINMEKTNARFLTPEDFPELMDWMTTDVAFISLTKILPAAYSILKENGSGVALIKPQFEAGKENVGKKGVVRDAAVHEQVINNVISFAKGEGFGIAGLDFSPIKGPEGNIEYLLHLTLGDDDAVSSEQVAQLVGRSHGDLDKKAEKTEA
jgi:23S rRNA (cytidine1920-2'-O)/16S rRNA (cytidine1409-2'-O)-methyltransferase